MMVPNSDICNSLRAFHRPSFRQSYRGSVPLDEFNFCCTLSDEISSMRIASGVVEGRSTCAIFEPSSVEIDPVTTQRCRCRLIAKARDLHVSADPVFVGCESFLVNSNKRAAFLCYRLPLDLHSSYTYFLPHPLFGCRDRSARISLDLAGGLLWLTVTWAGGQLPLGPNLLKLTGRKPEEFQLSFSEESIFPEKGFETALERINQDLCALNANLNCRLRNLEIVTREYSRV